MSAERRSTWRILRFPLFIILAVVIFGYTFQVTKVNLDEIRSETRQAQLTRVLRELARPRLLTYERIDTPTDLPFASPCGPDLDIPEYGPDDRHIIVEPSCGEPGVTVTVTGVNFSPNARGKVFQVPASGDIELRLADFIADGNGSFELTINTRERPSDEPQIIRAVTQEPIGSLFNPTQVETDEGMVRSPRISDESYDTWDKIVETVLMAFLATSLGVLLAVPLSFVAARNIMRDVTTTALRLGLQLLALPFGLAAGVLVARWMQGISTLLTDNAAAVVAGLVAVPVGIFLLLRRAFPPIDVGPVPRRERIIRVALTAVSAAAAIFVLYLLADLLTDFGSWASSRLDRLEFIAGFIATLGDILAAIITLTTALITAAVAVQLSGKLGIVLRRVMPEAGQRALSIPVLTAAGALLFLLVGQGVGWLYQLNDPFKTTWGPAATGAAIGLYFAIRSLHKDKIGIGLAVYYMARTIFNATRSVEPLIMVIVFAVWVGLGPFAGSLALALHTVAALAKLYSEQVESILPGPVEAVKASGATKLQTVVYAVLPQVIPPYISFTLYRWDINVRMSTIIGFAGGGGIGLVLQQNIRLLNYRAASVNMLAIAIVVATMDYLSARIRESIV